MFSFKHSLLIQVVLNWFAFSRCPHCQRSSLRWSCLQVCALLLYDRTIQDSSAPCRGPVRASLLVWWSTPCARQRIAHPTMSCTTTACLGQYSPRSGYYGQRHVPTTILPRCKLRARPRTKGTFSFAHGTFSCSDGQRVCYLSNPGWLHCHQLISRFRLPSRELQRNHRHYRLKQQLSLFRRRSPCYSQWPHGR